MPKTTCAAYVSAPRNCTSHGKKLTRSVEVDQVEQGAQRRARRQRAARRQSSRNCAMHRGHHQAEDDAQCVVGGQRDGDDADAEGEVGRLQAVGPDEDGRDHVRRSPGAVGVEHARPDEVQHHQHRARREPGHRRRGPVGRTPMPTTRSQESVHGGLPRARHRGTHSAFGSFSRKWPKQVGSPHTTCTPETGTRQADRASQRPMIRTGRRLLAAARARSWPQPPSTSCPADWRSLVSTPRRCSVRAICRGALPRRAPERQAVDRVVRDHVQHAYLPAQQPHDAVELVVAVVDAFEQRPLVLDRIAGGARVALAGRHQFVRRRCAARAAAAAARSAGLVVCSDSASAGFTRPCGRRSNTRGSPTVENTRFLWPMPPAVPSSSIASSTLSRLCAGSPMPMNTTLLAPAGAVPRQRHLGDDLGAAELAQQAVAAGHAEHAADRAADLRWRRTGRRAAAARSRPSGRRRARPAGARSRRRRGAPSCRRARPCELGLDAPGSACAAAMRAGSPRAGACRCPAACACAHRRSTRCSWLGPAPAARRRWRKDSIRMQRS